MAPSWYRHVLAVEEVVLRHAYPRLRSPGAGSEGRLPGPLANARKNFLGNLIAERAVPGEVPGWVIAQHVARYTWALPRCEGKRVVELGSGMGYGAHLLSWSANSVLGVDIDAAAVADASRRYPHVEYRVADLLDPGVELPGADIAVCFEVLEHLETPDEFFRFARIRYPRLLLSFPNPLMHGTHLNPHHRVDWPLSHLSRRLRRSGWTTLRIYHQTRREPAVRAGAWPWSSIWVVDAFS